MAQRRKTPAVNADLADMLARTDDVKIVNPKDVHDTFETGQDYTVIVGGDSARVQVSQANGAYNAVLGAVIGGSGGGSGTYGVVYGSGNGSGATGAVYGNGGGSGVTGVVTGSGGGSGTYGEAAGSGGGSGALGVVTGPGSGSGGFFYVGFFPTATGTGVGVDAVAFDAPGTGSHPAAVRGTVVSPAVQWAGYFSGPVFASGGFTTSDERLKRKIESLSEDEAVKRIASVRVATFEKRVDGSSLKEGIKQGRERQDAQRQAAEQERDALRKRRPESKEEQESIKTRLKELDEAIKNNSQAVPDIDEEKLWLGRRQAGVIAQEYYKINPEAVREDKSSGYLSVDESQIFFDNVLATQYLLQVVANQQKQIAELQAAVGIKQPEAAPKLAAQVGAPKTEFQAMRAQLKPCPIITAAQPVSVPFVQVVDATPQPVGVTTVAAQQKAPRKKKGASK